MSQNRIHRIQHLEEKYDQALTAIAKLDAAMEDFQSVIPEIEALITYYESDLWREDFQADENGELPADLKRGILSEDGIYNLLTDYQRLKKVLT